MSKVAAAVSAGRLKTAAAIGLRVGRVVGRAKMAKHFGLDIGDGRFGFSRDEAGIAAEAALDGLYVVRTSLGPERLDAPGVVSAYKALSHTEAQFRTFKHDLAVCGPCSTSARAGCAATCCCASWRPTCAGSWSATWHRCCSAMRIRPSEPTRCCRQSVQRPRRRKDAARQTPDGLPVSSLRGLLKHLATLTRNSIVPHGLGEEAGFQPLSVPTPLQTRAFELLGVNPARM